MNRFTEEVKIVFRDWDASTKDTLIQGNVSTAWIDMLGFDEVTCIMFRTVGTSSVQDSNISVSASSTGTNAAVVTSSGSTECTGSLVDATAAKTSTAGVGIIVLNATYDDIQGTLEGGRFIAMKASITTATDEFGIIYIRTKARERKADLLVSASG